MLELPPPGHIRMQVVLTLPESLWCDIFQYARSTGRSVEQLLSDNLVEVGQEADSAALALATMITPREFPAGPPAGPPAPSPVAPGANGDVVVSSPPGSRP